MAAPLRVIFFFIQRNFFSSDPRVQLAPRDLLEDRLSRAKSILPNRSRSRLAIASREITKAVVGSLDARVSRDLEKWNRAFKYNRFLNRRTYLTRAVSRPLDALDRILLASTFRSRPAFRARRSSLSKQGLLHRNERGRKQLWPRGRRDISAHLRCLRSNASCTAD